MAKRKRQHRNATTTALARPRPTVMRQAPSYAAPTILTVSPPRAQRTRGNASGSSMGWNVAAAIAGGLAGAGLAAGLYAAGVGPYWTGGLTTVGGTGMALLLNGKARWFGAGLAAAGSAQLGVTYFSQRALKKAQQQAQAQQQALPPGDGRRSAGGGLTPDEVLEAFARARQAAAFSAADAQARAQAEAALRAADAQVAAMQAAMMQAHRNAPGVMDTPPVGAAAAPPPSAAPASPA